MLNKIIAILLASTAVVLFMSESHACIQVLLSTHDWIGTQLSEVFTNGQAGTSIKNLIALLTPPILLSIIPTIIYWLVRKKPIFPFFMNSFLFVWLIQTGALIATYHITT